MRFGELVAAARAAKGWSQNRLAREAGMNQPTLHKLEKSGDDRTELGTALALANALAVPLGELVGQFSPSGAAESRPHLDEETKVQKRRRTITLPPIAVKMLIRRREIAESEEFVFTKPDGRLIRHSALRKVWWRAMVAKARAIAADAGHSFPERLRMYDLRHTANVLMGLAGVPIEVAAARMGHSSIALTADTYGHLQPAQHDDAAARIEALLAALSHDLRHHRFTGNGKTA